jgi:L-2-hydroxyglutarate oxidase LhgO
MALRYWRTGLAEMWRDVSRRAFADALRRYVPELRDDDLVSRTSGVRAQAMAVTGDLVDDFVITGSGRSIHVRNAPSPAATSSLAIADVIVDQADDRLRELVRKRDRPVPAPIPHPTGRADSSDHHR